MSADDQLTITALARFWRPPSWLVGLPHLRPHARRPFTFGGARATHRPLRRTAPRTRCRSRRRWWPRLRVPETTGSRQICRQACVHSVPAALLLGVVLQDAGDRKRSAGTLLVRDRDVGGDARIGGVVLASRVGDQALQFGAAALVAERKEAQEDDWQHVALVVRGLDGAPQVDRGLPELRGSEPDYLRPGDLRVSFAQFRRYASACLAKQRQTAQYRALND